MAKAKGSGKGTEADLQKMSFNLSSKERAILEKLANEQQMTKTAVIRTSLRLYERVLKDVKEGKKFYVENGGSKVELFLI